LSIVAFIHTHIYTYIWFIKRIIHGATYQRSASNVGV